MAARGVQMPRLLLAALGAAILGVCSGTGLETHVNPVQKVIVLLEKLKAQSEDEGQKEAMSYDKFACFCKAQAQSKLKTIADASAKIKLLESRVKKWDSEVVALNEDVEDTNKKLEAVEAEMKEEQEKRDKTHHQYTIERADVVEAVRGASEAIEVVKAGDKTGAAFLQVGSGLADTLERATSDGALRHLSPAQTERITALLEEADPATGEAAGSKFHSGEIVDNLMKVLKTFKVQKNKLEEEEAKKKHEFDMAQNGRSNQKKAFKATVAKNEEIIASKESEINAANVDKKKTETDKDTDQAFLDNLVVECDKTAKSWDARSKTRANELLALNEALEIIQGKVSQMYGANKKLTLLSTEIDGEHHHGHWEWVPGNSFLQMRSHHRHRHHPASLIKKVERLLRRQAVVLKSPTLSTLVLKLKEDHFKKVRTMIKDLIAKLKADAEADQTQKGWCDEEMGKATSKRDENIGLIEGDTASITETKAKLDTLATEIKELEVEVSELFKALKEATKIRTEEKDENKKTVDDATAGLGAVKAAIKVLKDFYEEGGFLQVGDDPAPPPEKGSVQDVMPKTGFEEDYTGNKDQSAGIIGMMEVIQADFEGTISETESAEKEAEDEYKTFKEETEASIQEKKDSSKSKKEETNTAKADLTGFKDDLKEHKDIKAEALAELAKLQPACVDDGMSYQERVARREQEINSLKNAYKILDDM